MWYFRLFNLDFSRRQSIYFTHVRQLQAGDREQKTKNAPHETDTANEFSRLPLVTPTI